MFKKILVAVDKGKPALRAVKVAVDLVEQVGGQIGVLHVIDSTRAFIPELAITDNELMAALRKEGKAILASACDEVPRTLNVKRIGAEGEPADAIIQTAVAWGADLIVIGSDSRGRLAHFLLGSTADSVIRRAPCPVMTVRADAKTSTVKGSESLAIA